MDSVHLTLRQAFTRAFGSTRLHYALLSADGGEVAFCIRCGTRVALCRSTSLSVCRAKGLLLRLGDGLVFPEQLREILEDEGVL